MGFSLRLINVAVVEVIVLQIADVFLAPSFDLRCQFSSICLFDRCDADKRCGSDVTQIGRYLLIGCKGMLDVDVRHA